MIALCNSFVECGIKSDADGLTNVLENFMNDAIKRQQDKGCKAMYRSVLLPYTHAGVKVKTENMKLG